MKVVLVLCVVIGSVFAGTPYQACKGVSGDVTVTGVNIVGCTAPPCILKKGTTAAVNGTFKVSTEVKGLSNKVYGELGGIDVPFPGYPADQVDVCKLLVSGSCPLETGKEYTETIKLPVASSDPAISVTAKWKFVDSDGKEQGCVEIPFKIES